jgi:hypothetical protein
MNPIPHAIAYIRNLARAGVPPRDAARRFIRRYPEQAIAILDRVGSWPSSTAELRAIQSVWP